MDELKPGALGHLDEDFEASHNFIMSQPITWVHDQLVKLGRWPYERLPIRVLSHIEAAERLKNRSQASLCLIRALTCVEAHDGKLYLVHTPALISGVRLKHHSANDGRLRRRIRDLYNVTLD